MSRRILLSLLGAALIYGALTVQHDQRPLILLGGLAALVLVDVIQRRALAMKLQLAGSVLLLAVYFILLSRLFPVLEPYWIVLSILTMVLLIILKGFRR